MSVSELETEQTDGPPENKVQEVLDKYNMTHQDVFLLIGVLSVVVSVSGVYIKVKQ
jgi:hypothetical protein